VTTTTAVAAAAAGVDARSKPLDDVLRMWHAYVDTGWWHPAGESVRMSARVHLSRWHDRNGTPAPAPFTPLPSLPESLVRSMDACTVEALTYARRTWSYGVRPVTVEDLAPVTTGADSAALHTWARVEALPRRPKDLHDIPANAFPRGGDPAPVALTPRVSSRHRARTSTGGAPPT
jgi:hypothetical protein